MTEPAANTNDASQEARYQNRYEQVRELLSYTFKMPSPYGSRRVAVVSAEFRIRAVLKRIYPIAYRGMFSHFVFGSGMAVSGGIRPFLWMTIDGELIVQESGRYKVITIRDLVQRITADDYDLLVLWLSNDAEGALRLIKENSDEENKKVWIV